MKLRLVLLSAILILGILVSGCSKPNQRLKQPSQTSQGTVQPSVPGPSGQPNRAAPNTRESAQELKKLTPTQLEAQADKVQAEIDQLLSDLDHDSDELNLAKERN